MHHGDSYKRARDKRTDLMPAHYRNKINNEIDPCTCYSFDH